MKEKVEFISDFVTGGWYIVVVTKRTSHLGKQE
jgi:hypothetical protein